MMETALAACKIGRMTTVFLLSPAYCGGRRATMLVRPGATHQMATRLESGTLSLGEAFAFMSGLYFRGKLAYAQAFGRRTGDDPAVLVITPTRGLQRPDHIVSRTLIEEFATTDVADDEPKYREPLVADAERLAGGLPSDARVVLLGSVATTKYVEVLSDVFADNLCFPSDFVGRGDMSRGALLLRSASAGTELPYVAVSSAPKRHGPRPPRMTKG
jgi:hypothetical protein